MRTDAARPDPHQRRTIVLRLVSCRSNAPADTRTLPATALKGAITAANGPHSSTLTVLPTIASTSSGLAGCPAASSSTTVSAEPEPCRHDNRCRYLTAARTTPATGASPQARTGMIAR
jgi:hypothetical protein